MRAIAWAMLVLSLIATPVLAHGVNEHDEHDAAPVVAHPGSWHELARTWGWEPASIVGLVLSGSLYGIGLRRMWRGGGIGSGLKTWQAWCFAAGWFTLFIALVSPLHPWGSVLFSAHMVQHEVLMIVAAPLVVLGYPLAVMLKALSAQTAHQLAEFGNSKGWLTFWRFISGAFIAWLIHAIALWVWHLPTLFQATLHNEWIHAAQHTSFLVTALMFWWAVVHGHNRAMSYGMAVLYMFTTALHSGLLGALLTFATQVWYPDYARTAPAWGLTALEDQQLGGLIMWIPAGLVYVVAGLALFVAWMKESERRVLRTERISPSPGNPGEGRGEGTPSFATGAEPSP